MPLSQMDKIRPLYDAVQVHRNEYSSGGADFSVTTLLDNPRVVFLNKRHLHKVPLFVSDLLHSYNGTGAHAYWQYCMEKIPNTPYQCEERLSVTINNHIVSGAYDCVYDKRDMYDMKNTSVWKIMFGSKDDWAAQQNMYRWLYRNKHGIELDSVRIIGLFRDWKKNDMFKSGPKYPKQPAVEYRLPLWEYDETYKFMEEKVNTLIKYNNTKDDDLPYCSFEDMWSKPDQVAVKSTRVKKAVRVLSSQKAADNFVKNYLKGKTCKDSLQTLSYEVRPAKRTRCEEWCPVNGYCNQYQEYLKTKANNGGKSI